MYRALDFLAASLRRTLEQHSFTRLWAAGGKTITNQGILSSKQLYSLRYHLVACLRFLTFAAKITEHFARVYYAYLKTENNCTLAP